MSDVIRALFLAAVPPSKTPLALDAITACLLRCGPLTFEGTGASHPLHSVADGVLPANTN